MNTLILLYSKFVLVFQYKQKKEEEEAKRLAYLAIRNAFLVIFLFGLMTLHSVIEIFVFKNPISWVQRAPRWQLWLIIAVPVLSYLYLSSKFLKPRLQVLETTNKQESDIKKFNLLYIILIISMGIFGSLMFVVNRLLYIHFT